MLQFIILILVVYLILSIPILINNYLVDKNKSDFSGKINNKLLTENEYKFYIKLKEITEKYNLIIFSKVRLADIITAKNYTDFNKIRSKHIDFLICNQKSEFIKFIELDDSTHKKSKNKKNDKMKDEILKKVNTTIYRIKINEIDKKLQELDNELKMII